MSHKRKTVLGYRVGRYDEHGYRKAELTVCHYQRRDAMEQVRQHLRSSLREQYLQRAAELSDATGDTVYLVEDDWDGVRLIWQANNDAPHDWYGLRVEVSGRSLGVLDCVRRIVRRAGLDIEQAGPADVVRALARAGAIQVEYYGEPVHAYVPASAEPGVILTERGITAPAEDQQVAAAG